MLPPQAAPPFSCEALRILFAPPAFRAFQKPGYMSHYWAPLLSVCSGIGRDDIFFLRPDDVLRQHGLWLLRIGARGSGSAALPPSIRRIPVHPTLQRLGFLDFANERRATHAGERLFSEYKAGQEHAGVPFSRAFAHWIQTIASGLPEEERRLFAADLHFPSLRARFWVQAAQSAMSEATMQWLRGTHAEQSTPDDGEQERRNLEHVAAELGNVDIESCLPPLLRYEALLRCSSSRPCVPAGTRRTVSIQPPQGTHEDPHLERQSTQTR